MVNWKHVLKVHNQICDRVWVFLTKPNPPAKSVVMLPRTGMPINNFVHFIGDTLAAVRTKIDKAFYFFMIAMFWIAITLVGLIFVLQAWKFFSNF